MLLSGNNYNGDIDGMHIDYERNIAFIFDLKYQPYYRALKPRTKDMYELLANTMTDGGLYTYVCICGHKVDYKDTGDPCVPIDACSVLEIYHGDSWADYTSKNMGVSELIDRCKTATDNTNAFLDSLIPSRCPAHTYN
jgi:hypothetical protein